MENRDEEGQENKDGQQPTPPFRYFAMLVILVVLVVSMFMVFQGQQEKPVPKNFKPWFTEQVKNETIVTCEVITESPGIQYIKGTYKDPEIEEPVAFKVDILVGPALEQYLFDNVKEFKYTTINPMWRDFLLGGLIPLIVLLALVYFLIIRQMRSAGKGAMNFGKSRAKLMTRNKNRITFKDVAGVEEAQDEVFEIIEFLRNPKKYQKLGGRIPKGVMLIGPPGTGKTLLAKAIAGEAEVPFFSISGSDFVEMFVGVGASRVRDMFEQGKKNAPCIIFIDEIDAVGRSRFSGIGGGHDEREQTLNALLVEMDGFDTQEGVIIVAATNRADVLDTALMRPGRFDRQIAIDLPGMEGREKILDIHCKNIKLSKKANLQKVARGTPGFSGADLANLVNEAALLAARRDAKAVGLDDMFEARDKVRFGTERRSRMLDEEENNLTAYHEAGHALVMEVLEHCEPVHKVTIIPRGQSLGSTMQLPEKDQFTQGKKKLLDMLVSFMGGRAAEDIVFDDITTGASNDLKQATSIVRAMICQFGMSDKVGPQSFGGGDEPIWLGREMSRSQTYSEQTAQLIDTEVAEWLRRAYEHAIQILKENREALDVMAKELVERETIDGNDVHEIVKYKKILSNDERKELNPKAYIAPKEKKPEVASNDSDIGGQAEDDGPPLGATTSPA